MNVPPLVNDFAKIYTIIEDKKITNAGIIASNCLAIACGTCSGILITIFLFIKKV